MSVFSELLETIQSGRETVGIIGMGYVGLPMAVTLAESVNVIGFDNNPERVDGLQSGRSHLRSVENETLKKRTGSGRLTVSRDFAMLGQCDVILVCVPTPLDEGHRPDLAAIRETSENIARNMKAGVLICLESTVYPGCTEEFVLPLLKAHGAQPGTDFWLVFSPERVSPEVTAPVPAGIPKVIGALGDDARRLAEAFYRKLSDSLHTVSGPRAAEMVKVLENTYRMINISMVNELALLCGKMDLDIWEVIEAASTKPFGFEPFYPGPGIGGHCIPLDPFYLEHIASQHDFDLKMVHAAGMINKHMPHRMVVKINSALNSRRKAVAGSDILFLGVTYKENVDDIRESAALKIMQELRHKGARIHFCDPYVSHVRLGADELESLQWDKLDFSDFDCTVITARHSVMNLGRLADEAPLIVDLRNATRDLDIEPERLFKL